MPVILLIEDEAALLDIEAKALGARGYSVHSVSSAEDAKEWLAENQADLIVIDVMLPGQGGVDFMLEMHSRADDASPPRPVPKILFTSGYVDTSHEIFRTVTEKFGVAAVPLQKPFTVEEFIVRVEEVLSQPSA